MSSAFTFIDSATSNFLAPAMEKRLKDETPDEVKKILFKLVGNCWTEEFSKAHASEIFEFIKKSPDCEKLKQKMDLILSEAVAIAMTEKIQQKAIDPLNKPVKRFMPSIRYDTPDEMALSLECRILPEFIEEKELIAKKTPKTSLLALLFCFFSGASALKPNSDSVEKMVAVPGKKKDDWLHIQPTGWYTHIVDNTIYYFNHYANTDPFCYSLDSNKWCLKKMVPYVEGEKGYDKDKPYYKKTVCYSEVSFIVGCEDLAIGLYVKQLMEAETLQDFDDMKGKIIDYLVSNKELDKKTVEDCWATKFTKKK